MSKKQKYVFISLFFSWFLGPLEAKLTEKYKKTAQKLIKSGFIRRKLVKIIDK